MKHFRRRKSTASRGGVSRSSSQIRPSGESLLDSAHPPINNSSAVRSQARSTRWINRNRVNAQLTSLAAGRQSALKDHSPSHEDLVQQVNQEYNASLPTPQSVTAEIKATAAEIRQSMQSERKVIQDLLSSWDAGAFGFIPSEKPDGRIRVMFENWNSLKLLQPGKRHVGRLNSLINQLQIDCVAGCEAGFNWSNMPDSLSFHQVLGFGKTRKSVTGYNRHERLGRSSCQHGGTAMMALELLSNFVVQDKGADALGRWCWMKVGTGAVFTRLIVAYSPIKPGSTVRKKAKGMGKRVWQQ